MKRIYWRPPTVSRAALALISMVAIGAMLLVEALPVKRRQGGYAQKVRAAQLLRTAMNSIKTEKARRGIKLNRTVDPSGSGVIGVPLSPVTSNTGYLKAKQTSINPNWAAVVVHLIKRAGVKQGQKVALGVSGSFPALNMATYAACETLDLSAVVIASASSSEWGANNADLLWIDMERVLSDARLFGIRSVAGSLGGIDDRGFGMSKEGRAMLEAAIARNGLERIEGLTLRDSVEQRMAIYDKHAEGQRYAAYINVGGGAASVGTHVGKKAFRSGLNLAPPRRQGLVDGVMLRFANRGVPVIHLSSISKLADKYGLPEAPARLRPIGEARVYVREEPNRWLAAAAVVLIFVAMFVFIRLDVGTRILRGAYRPKQDTRHPEPMV